MGFSLSNVDPASWDNGASSIISTGKQILHNLTKQTAWYALKARLLESFCNDDSTWPLEEIEMLNLSSSSHFEYVWKKCSEIRTVSSYLMWVAVSTGVPMNILALAAMLTLRSCSVGVWLICLLTFTDLAVLVVHAIAHVFLTNYFDVSGVTCGLEAPLEIFFPCFGRWLLVLVCFERAYTLDKACKKIINSTDTLRVTMVLIGFLFNFILAFSAMHVFLRTMHANISCEIENPDIAQATSTVENGIVVYAPSLLMILAVLRIVWVLQTTQRSLETNGAHENLVEKRAATISVLCMAFLALMLTVPLCGVMMVAPDSSATDTERVDWMFYHAITEGLVRMIHATNMFVYVATYRPLRIHVRRVIILNVARLHRHRVPVRGLGEEITIEPRDIPLTKLSRRAVRS